MPMLVRVAKEYEGRGVRLVAIANDDLDQQKEAVAGFIARQPQLAPYAAYGTPDVGQRYLVKGLPTLYVIDRHGAIVGAEVGQLSENQLRRWIDRALARE
jgi:thiol-disulfide isomerase/thioredoxin